MHQQVGELVRTRYKRTQGTVCVSAANSHMELFNQNSCIIYGTHTFLDQ